MLRCDPFCFTLAVWDWDGSNWQHGRNDLGTFAPLASTVGIQTNGIVTNGVYFSGATGALRYPITDSSGRLNVRLDQGSLALWFKPDWTLTNWPTGSPRLFEVGSYGSAGWWGWYFEPQNDSYKGTEWRLKMSQWSSGFITTRYTMPFRDNYSNCYESYNHQSSWAQPGWHEFRLTYDTNRTLAYHNENLLLAPGPRDANNDCTQWIVGSGLLPDKLPGSSQLANGLAFGSQINGTANHLDGAMESVASYNYPVGEAEIFRQQQLTVQIVTNASSRQLRFLRAFDIAGTNWGPSEFRPWPLTLWRRGLGATNWGTALLTDSLTDSWTDTNVTAGTTYEYKAQLTYASGLPYVRHFFAGIAMPPQHQRGNVILLVDSTLESSLTNELATLRTNLVGDGWTVRQATAPRHDDLLWTNNRLNLTNVVNLITSNTVSGTTNVVFLLGHVVIPYSGTEAADGHDAGSPDGDHRGAWTADAYYGYLNNTGWADSFPITNSSQLSIPNDGKFDPDYLVGYVTTNDITVGRPPDMAVGRLDFARLSAFGDAPWVSAAAKTNTLQLEVEMTRMYLAKNWRYRTNGVPTFGRVSAYLGNYAVTQGANAAQSFAGAAFGVEPAQVFSGFNLLDRVPADLGVHYLSGHDTRVQDGRGQNYFSTNFVSQAQEIPVTFRQVWFSFASDWARLNTIGNTFDRPNNWLRASLGWTNYGLATLGGTAWDFAPLGGGGPLAMTMTHGWEGQSGVPRFQSILGDPTLRLHRLASVSDLRATRSGSTVSLSWGASPEVDCGYYLYRSTNGLAGFNLPLNSVSVPTLSFIDTTSSTNLLYQVRAAKLQITGSGSFTNLSQGMFIQVP